MSLKLCNRCKVYHKGDGMSDPKHCSAMFKPQKSFKEITEEVMRRHAKTFKKLRDGGD